MPKPHHRKVAKPLKPVKKTNTKAPANPPKGQRILGLAELSQKTAQASRDGEWGLVLPHGNDGERSRDSDDQSHNASSHNASVDEGDLHNPTVQVFTKDVLQPDDTEFPLDGTRLPAGYVIPEPVRGQDTRRSAIWRHGHKIARTDDTEQKTHWMCKFCHKDNIRHTAITYRYSGSTTTNAEKHLRDYHGIEKHGNKIEPKSGRIEQSFAAAVEINAAKNAAKYDHRTWKRAFIEWVIVDTITLSQSVSPRLLKLFEATNPGLGPSPLHTSRDTTRNWIMSEFNARRMDIKKLIDSAVSRISISFDGWQSNNGIHFLGICAHFIDSEYKMRSILIAMPRFTGDQSGVSQAAMILPVLKLYGIDEEHLGWFVTDNATNNDTTLEELSKSIKFDSTQRRIRCVGHILNLIAQPFLFGPDSAQLEKEIRTSKSTDDLLAAWRKRGSVGKVHNLVVHITRTSKRVEAFAEAQSREKDAWTRTDKEPEDPIYSLVRDGGVRWNSTYLMIDRAIAVHRALSLYCYEHGTDIDPEDRLSQDDWAELILIKSILQPIYELTINLQGNVAKQNCDGLLHEVVLALEVLAKRFKARNVELEQDPLNQQVKISLDAAIEKVKTYLKYTRKSAAWAASAILHPKYKYVALKNVLGAGKPKLVDAHEKTKEMWLKNYACVPDERPTGSEPPTKKSRFDLGEFEIQARTDEFDDYTASPTFKTDDAIGWWKLHRNRYPKLSRMALDLLAIPAMSDECERTFSRASYGITSRRSQLGCDMIEAGECLKSWYHRGAI